MDEISKALELAAAEFHKEFGEDVGLEDGEEFVVIFNNCILYMGKEGTELKVKFIGGKPYFIDYSLSIYKDGDEE